MVKITIIPSDKVVIIDNVARKIDFTGISATVHAVQFDTVVGKGRLEIEKVTDDGSASSNVVALTDITPYQIFIDRWIAAAPLPISPPTQEELDRIARRVTLVTEATIDTFIDALRGATPTQIRAFVQDNVTDLVSTKTFLAKLAIAVAYALANGTDK